MLPSDYASGLQRELWFELNNGSQKVIIRSTRRRLGTRAWFFLGSGRVLKWNLGDGDGARQTGIGSDRRWRSVCGRWRSLALLGPPILPSTHQNFTRASKSEARSAARLSPRISFLQAATSPTSKEATMHHFRSTVGTRWGGGPRSDGLASPSSTSGIFRRVAIGLEALPRLEPGSCVPAPRPWEMRIFHHNLEARSRLRKSKHNP